MPSSTRNYQAVIFDMDGLLFDTERTNRWAWDRALENHGFEMTDQIYLKFIGRDTGYRERILKEHFGSDFPFGPIFEERLKIGDAREIKYGVSIKPGAQELLIWLQEIGVPTGLATGTIWDRTLRRLLSTDLKERFSVIVTREDVPNGKPSPDLFLECSHRLGINPENCIALEDSNSGVESASMAGMCTIMVPDLEPPSEEAKIQAKKIVNSLDATRPIFRKLLKIQS